MTVQVLNFGGCKLCHLYWQQTIQFGINLRKTILFPVEQTDWNFHAGVNIVHFSSYRKLIISCTYLSRRNKLPVFYWQHLTEPLQRYKFCKGWKINLEKNTRSSYITYNLTCLIYIYQWNIINKVLWVQLSCIVNQDRVELNALQHWFYLVDVWKHLRCYRGPVQAKMPPQYNFML